MAHKKPLEKAKEHGGEVIPLAEATVQSALAATPAKTNEEFAGIERTAGKEAEKQTKKAAALDKENGGALREGAVEEAEENVGTLQELDREMRALYFLEFAKEYQKEDYSFDARIGEAGQLMETLAKHYSEGENAALAGILRLDKYAQALALLKGDKTNIPEGAEYLKQMEALTPQEVAAASKKTEVVFYGVDVESKSKIDRAAVSRGAEAVEGVAGKNVLDALDKLLKNAAEQKRQALAAKTPEEAKGFLRRAEASLGRADVLINATQNYIEAVVNLQQIPSEEIAQRYAAPLGEMKAALDGLATSFTDESSTKEQLAASKGAFSSTVERYKFESMVISAEAEYARLLKTPAANPKVEPAHQHILQIAAHAIEDSKNTALSFEERKQMLDAAQEALESAQTFGQISKKKVIGPRLELGQFIKRIEEDPGSVFLLDEDGKAFGLTEKGTEGFVRAQQQIQFEQLNARRKIFVKDSAMAKSKIVSANESRLVVRAAAQELKTLRAQYQKAETTAERQKILTRMEDVTSVTESYVKAARATKGLHRAREKETKEQAEQRAAKVKKSVDALGGHVKELCKKEITDKQREWLFEKLIPAETGFVLAEQVRANIDGFRKDSAKWGKRVGAQLERFASSAEQFLEMERFANAEAALQDGRVFRSTYLLSGVRGRVVRPEKKEAVPPVEAAPAVAVAPKEKEKKEEFKTKELNSKNIFEYEKIGAKKGKPKSRQAHAIARKDLLNAQEARENLLAAIQAGDGQAAGLAAMQMAQLGQQGAARMGNLRSAWSVREFNAREANRKITVADNFFGAPGEGAKPSGKVSGEERGRTEFTPDVEVPKVVSSRANSSAVLDEMSVAAYAGDAAQVNKISKDKMRTAINQDMDEVLVPMGNLAFLPRKAEPKPWIIDEIDEFGVGFKESEAAAPFSASNKEKIDKFKESLDSAFHGMLGDITYVTGIDAGRKTKESKSGLRKIERNARKSEEEAGKALAELSHVKGETESEWIAMRGNGTEIPDWSGMIFEPARTPTGWILESGREEMELGLPPLIALQTGLDAAEQKAAVAESELNRQMGLLGDGQTALAMLQQIPKGDRGKDIYADSLSRGARMLGEASDLPAGRESVKAYAEAIDKIAMGAGTAIDTWEMDLRDYGKYRWQGGAVDAYLTSEQRQEIRDKKVSSLMRTEIAAREEGLGHRFTPEERGRVQKDPKLNARFNADAEKEVQKINQARMQEAIEMDPKNLTRFAEAKVMGYALYTLDAVPTFEGDVTRGTFEVAGLTPANELRATEAGKKRLQEKYEIAVNADRVLSPVLDAARYSTGFWGTLAGVDYYAQETVEAGKTAIAERPLGRGLGRETAIARLERIGVERKEAVGNAELMGALADSLLLFGPGAVAGLIEGGIVLGVGATSTQIIGGSLRFGGEAAKAIKEIQHLYFITDTAANMVNGIAVTGDIRGHDAWMLAFMLTTKKIAPLTRILGATPKIARGAEVAYGIIGSGSIAWSGTSAFIDAAEQAKAEGRAIRGVDWLGLGMSWFPAIQGPLTAAEGRIMRGTYARIGMRGGFGGYKLHNMAEYGKWKLTRVEARAGYAKATVTQKTAPRKAKAPVKAKLEQNLKALGITKSARANAEKKIGASALRERTNALMRTFRGIEGIVKEVLEANPELLTQPQAKFEANVKRLRQTRENVQKIKANMEERGLKVPESMEKDARPYLDVNFRTNLWIEALRLEAENMGITTRPKAAMVAAEKAAPKAEAKAEVTEYKTTAERQNAVFTKKYSVEWAEKTIGENPPVKGEIAESQKLRELALNRIAREPVEVKKVLKEKIIENTPKELRETIELEWKIYVEGSITGLNQYNPLKEISGFTALKSKGLAPEVKADIDGFVLNANGANAHGIRSNTGGHERFTVTILIRELPQNVWVGPMKTGAWVERSGSSAFHGPFWIVLEGKANAVGGPVTAEQHIAYVCPSERYVVETSRAVKNAYSQGMLTRAEAVSALSKLMSAAEAKNAPATAFRSSPRWNPIAKEFWAERRAVADGEVASFERFSGVKVKKVAAKPKKNIVERIAELRAEEKRTRRVNPERARLERQSEQNPELKKAVEEYLRRVKLLERVKSGKQIGAVGDIKGIKEKQVREAEAAKAKAAKALVDAEATAKLVELRVDEIGIRETRGKLAAEFTARDVESYVGRGAEEVAYTDAEVSRAAETVYYAEKAYKNERTYEQIPKELRAKAEALSMNKEFQKAVDAKNNKTMLYMGLGQVAHGAELAGHLNAEAGRIRKRAETETGFAKKFSIEDARGLEKTAAFAEKGAWRPLVIEIEGAPQRVEAKISEIEGPMPRDLVDMRNVPERTRFKVELKVPGEAKPEVWTIEYTKYESGALWYDYVGVPKEYAAKLESTGAIRGERVFEFRSKKGRALTTLEAFTENILQARHELEALPGRGERGWEGGVAIEKGRPEKAAQNLTEPEVNVDQTMKMLVDLRERAKTAKPEMRKRLEGMIEKYERILEEQKTELNEVTARGAAPERAAEEGIVIKAEHFATQEEFYLAPEKVREAGKLGTEGRKKPISLVPPPPPKAVLGTPAREGARVRAYESESGRTLVKKYGESAVGKEGSAKGKESKKEFREVMQEVETRIEAITEGMSENQKIEFMEAWEKIVGDATARAETEGARTRGDSLAIEYDISLNVLSSLSKRLTVERGYGAEKPAALLEVYIQVGPEKAREAMLLAKQRGGPTTGKLNMTDTERTPVVEDVVGAVKKGGSTPEVLKRVVDGLSEEVVGERLETSREELVTLIETGKSKEAVRVLNETLVDKGIVLNLVDGELIPAYVKRSVESGRAKALVVEQVPGMKDPLSGRNAEFNRESKTILVKAEVESNEVMHEISHYDQYLTGIWELSSVPELEAIAKATDLGFSRGLRAEAMLHEIFELSSGKSGEVYAEAANEILAYRPGEGQYTLGEILAESGVKSGDSVGGIRRKVGKWTMERIPKGTTGAEAREQIDTLVKVRLRQFVDAKYQEKLGVAWSDIFSPIVKDGAPAEVAWRVEGARGKEVKRKAGPKRAGAPKAKESRVRGPSEAKVTGEGASRPDANARIMTSPFKNMESVEAINAIRERTKRKSLSARQESYLREQFESYDKRFSVLEVEQTAVADNLATVLQSVPVEMIGKRIAERMLIPVYYAKGTGKILGIGKRAAVPAGAERVDLIINRRAGRIIAIEGNLEKFWSTARVLEGMQVEEAIPGYDFVSPKEVADHAKKAASNELTNEQMDYVRNRFSKEKVYARDAEIVAENASKTLRVFSHALRGKKSARGGEETETITAFYNKKTGKIERFGKKYTGKEPVEEIKLTVNLAEGRIVDVRSVAEGEPSQIFNKKIKPLEGMQFRERAKKVEPYREPSIDTQPELVPGSKEAKELAKEVVELRVRAAKKGRLAAPKRKGKRVRERKPEKGAEPVAPASTRPEEVMRPAYEIPVEKITAGRMEQLAKMADRVVYEGAERPAKLSPREEVAYLELVKGAKRDKTQVDAGKAERPTPKELVRKHANKLVLTEFRSPAEKQQFRESINQSQDFNGERGEAWSNVNSVTVIGDGHGDFASVFALLERAGVIRKKPGTVDQSTLKGETRTERFMDYLNKQYEVLIGENDHVVSMGDSFDGDTTAMQLFTGLRWLERAAAKKGARVHMLMGNHEQLLLACMEHGFGQMDTAQMNELVVNLEKFEHHFKIREKQISAELERTGKKGNAELLTLKELFYSGKYPEYKEIARFFSSKIGIHLGKMRVLPTLKNFRNWYGEGRNDPSWWENAKVGLKADGTLDKVQNLKAFAIFDGEYLAHGGPNTNITTVEGLNKYYVKKFSGENEWRTNLGARMPEEGNYDYSYLGKVGQLESGTLGWNGESPGVQEFREGLAVNLGRKEPLRLYSGHSKDLKIRSEGEGVYAVDTAIAESENLTKGGKGEGHGGEALVLRPGEEATIVRGEQRTNETGKGRKGYSEIPTGLKNEISEAESIPVVPPTTKKVQRLGAPPRKAGAAGKRVRKVEKTETEAIGVEGRPEGVTLWPEVKVSEGITNLGIRPGAEKIGKLGLEMYEVSAGELKKGEYGLIKAKIKEHGKEYADGTIIRLREGYAKGEPFVNVKGNPFTIVGAGPETFGIFLSEGKMFISKRVLREVDFAKFIKADAKILLLNPGYLATVYKKDGTITGELAELRKRFPEAEIHITQKDYDQVKILANEGAQELEMLRNEGKIFIEDLGLELGQDSYRAYNKVFGDVYTIAPIERITAYRDIPLKKFKVDAEDRPLSRKEIPIPQVPENEVVRVLETMGFRRASDNPNHGEYNKFRRTVDGRVQHVPLPTPKYDMIDVTYLSRELLRFTSKREFAERFKELYGKKYLREYSQVGVKSAAAPPREIPRQREGKRDWSGFEGKEKKEPEEIGVEGGQEDVGKVEVDAAKEAEAYEKKAELLRDTDPVEASKLFEEAGKITEKDPKLRDTASASYYGDAAGLVEKTDPARASKLYGKAAKRYLELAKKLGKDGLEAFVEKNHYNPLESAIESYKVAAGLVGKTDPVLEAGLKAAITEAAEGLQHRAENGELRVNDLLGQKAAEARAKQNGREKPTAEDYIYGESVRRANEPFAGMISAEIDSISNAVPAKKQAEMVLSYLEVATEMSKRIPSGEMLSEMQLGALGEAYGFAARLHVMGLDALPLLTNKAGSGLLDLFPIMDEKAFESAIIQSEWIFNRVPGDAVALREQRGKKIETKLPREEALRVTLSYIYGDLKKMPLDSRSEYLDKVSSAFEWSPQWNDKVGEYLVDNKGNLAPRKVAAQKLPALAYLINDPSGLLLKALDNSAIRNELRAEKSFGAVLNLIDGLDRASESTLYKPWVALVTKRLEILTYGEKELKAAGIRDRIKDVRKEFIKEIVPHLNSLLYLNESGRIHNEGMNRISLALTAPGTETRNGFVDAMLPEMERIYGASLSDLGVTSEFMSQNPTLVLDLLSYRNKMARYTSTGDAPAKNEPGFAGSSMFWKIKVNEETGEMTRTHIKPNLSNSTPEAFDGVVPVLDLAISARVRGKEAFRDFKFSREFETELKKKYGPERGEKLFQEWRGDYDAEVSMGGKTYSLSETGKFEDGFYGGRVKGEITCQDPNYDGMHIGGIIGTVELPWIKQVILRERGSQDIAMRTRVFMVHGESGNPILLIQPIYNSSSLGNANALRAQVINMVKEKYAPIGVEVRVMPQSALNNDAGVNTGYMTFESGRSPLFYMDSNANLFRFKDDIAGRNGLQGREEGESVRFPKGWEADFDFSKIPGWR